MQASTQAQWIRTTLREQHWFSLTGLHEWGRMTKEQLEDTPWSTYLDLFLDFAPPLNLPGGGGGIDAFLAAPTKGVFGAGLFAMAGGSLSLGATFKCSCPLMVIWSHIFSHTPGAWLLFLTVMSTQYFPYIRWTKRPPKMLFAFLASS